jgi:hypothetical protein
MKKLVFTLASLFLFMSFAELSAQTKTVGGEWAIGARLGNPIGMSLKKYAGSNKSALEFIASWDFDDANDIEGFMVAGLWEKLAPLSGTGQLSAEFGAGPSMVFGDKFYAGLSGIIGFDWRLQSVPVSMSVDWMPSWIFIGANEFCSFQGAFTVRYILNNRKKK